MSDPLGGTAADAPSRHRRDPLAPPWYMRPFVWVSALILEVMSLRQYRAPKPEPQKGYTLSDLYEIKREMEESRWTSNEGAGPYWAIEFFAPKPRPDPLEQACYTISQITKWVDEVWDWRLAPYDNPNIILGEN